MMTMDVDAGSVSQETLDAAISKAEQCSAADNVSAAIEALSLVEKQTRLGTDLAGNTRVLRAMVDACKVGKNLDELENAFVHVSKKRGLVKEAFAAALQHIIQWASSLLPVKIGELDLSAVLPQWGYEFTQAAAPNIAAAKRLLEIVRLVSEGKIFVELEHARATRLYAAILESEGNTSGAADAMHGVAIETFGSVAKYERVSFLLDQIRLLLAVGQYSKATVACRKITTKTFEPADEYEQLRLKYLELAIQLSLHDDKYLDCSSHYLAIYNLPSVQSNNEAAVAALRHAVLLACLAPHLGCEQIDRLNQLSREKPVESGQLPLYRDLLKTFLTPELVRWPLVEAAFGAELRSFPVIFGSDASDSDGARRWRHLRDRVIEHNIRTIASVYDRISLPRFAQLLDLSIDDAEETLCRLVSKDKMVHALIDRTDGIVSFTPHVDSRELLESWDNRVRNILTSLSKVSHLIAKEEMVHASM